MLGALEWWLGTRPKQPLPLMSILGLNSTVLILPEARDIVVKEKRYREQFACLVQGSVIVIELFSSPQYVSYCEKS